MENISENTVLASNFFSQLTADDFFDVSEIQKDFRKKNEEALHQLQFPTTRNEYWKYTRIARLVKQQYLNPKTTNHKAILPNIEGVNSIKMVFENGLFRKDLSEPIKGDFIVLPLSQAKVEFTQIVDEHLGKLIDYKNHIFSAINGVYHADGLFVYIPQSVKTKPIIELINIGSGQNQLINQRNLIVLQNQTNAEIIFRDFAEDDCANFINNVSEIFVDANAHLTTYQVQRYSKTTSQVQTTQTQISADATYKNWLFTLSGDIVRNNHNCTFTGENAQSEIFGLYMPLGNSLVDNHTFIDHALPHCYSNELYRGIVSDKATAVFNGKVMVRPDAQKTNAFQANNNILLSENATVNSKPELEIYADDVKCSHGSTTGQMDEEALFYLQTRGINKPQALKLLTQAFAHEVLENMPNTNLKNYFNSLLENRFI